MYDFEKPNYKENNIINLMSSISNNFGKKHKYNELKALDARKNEIQSMITNTQFEQGSAQLPTSNMPMAGSGYENMIFPEKQEKA